LLIRILLVVGEWPCSATLPMIASTGFFNSFLHGWVAHGQIAGTPTLWRTRSRLHLRVFLIPKPDRLSSCIFLIVREVQVEEAEFMASQWAHKKLKFQRALYTRLLAELYPDHIGLTIRQRINKYHPEAALCFTHAMLQELKFYSFSLLAAFAQHCSAPGPTAGLHLGV